MSEPTGGKRPPRRGKTEFVRSSARRPSGDASPASGGPRAVAGLGARDLALAILIDVLDRRRAFDEAVATHFKSSQGLALDMRDRGLARLVASTTLRRLGVLDAVLAGYLEKPLGPKQTAVTRVLQAAAAQILYLDTPPHAAVSIAVTQCRRQPVTGRYAGLANAVLRRLVQDAPHARDGLDETRLSIPPALWDGWVAAYGETTARAIAAASLAEPPLDLTLRDPAAAAAWAERLGGVVLGTGGIRVAAGGRIEDRQGYADGAWWVQDSAASLPVLLIRDRIDGRDVADLCAAPGGKTAQLAAAGARVTAVDVSERRLARLRENLARLKLDAEVVAADVLTWEPGRQFDAVLLDAPCSATGTIRRHPDILHPARSGDLTALRDTQKRLLDSAAQMVKPGGILVYCTCSLEPAEGEGQVEAFLARSPAFQRDRVRAGEAGIPDGWITPDGDLRTLPFHAPSGDAQERGMDGFFVARLVRAAD